MGGNRPRIGKERELIKSKDHLAKTNDRRYTTNNDCVMYTRTYAFLPETREDRLNYGFLNKAQRESTCVITFDDYLTIINCNRWPLLQHTIYLFKMMDYTT